MRRKGIYRRLPESLHLRLSPNDDGKGPKARRITPHTNRAVGHITPQTSATQFDLAGLAFGPIPLPTTDYSVYNDDLAIEHYRHAPHSYAGQQRRGISEPFATALSYEQHIEAALNAPFPLHDPSPLPRGLELALRLNKDNDLETARAFRNKQTNAPHPHHCRGMSFGNTTIIQRYITVYPPRYWEDSYRPFGAFAGLYWHERAQMDPTVRGRVPVGRLSTPVTNVPHGRRFAVYVCRT